MSIVYPKDTSFVCKKCHGFIFKTDRDIYKNDTLFSFTYTNKVRFLLYCRTCKKKITLLKVKVLEN